MKACDGSNKYEVSGANSVDYAAIFAELADIGNEQCQYKHGAN
ncbi:Uncharacterised protein [Zhongshania aliphaticivorans]|uniref:Uncharacterized protein n=1 Tax=Zhongshania aliphaticivorans TaxID=1470434 RepID=A0A5S9PQD2_9GAMM|nr:Uncharacterised protein [Zhongshania aliphaticivorans]CAA0106560.1 Uncharacterised protein [Zhongshania aliphaticivorans]